MMASNLDDKFMSVFKALVTAYAAEHVQPLVDSVKRSLDELQGQVCTLDKGLTTLQSKATSLDKAVSERATIQQVKTLDSSVSSLDDAVRRKADVNRMEQLGQQVDGLRGDLTDLRNATTAGSETCKQLEEKIHQHGIQLQTLEHSFGAEVQRVKSTAEDLNKQLSASDAALKQELRQLGAMSERTSHQLKDWEQAFTKQQFAARMQGAEHKVTAIEKRVGEAERVLQGKAHVDSVRQLEASLPQAEKAIKDNSDRMENLEAILSPVGKQIAAVEQAIREKVGFGHIRQFESIVTGIQAHIATLEQALQEKAATNLFQKIRADLNNTDAKIADLDQALNEKVGAGQVQQLKSAITSFETKILSVEQAVQEKIGAGQMQQLKGIIMGIQQQMATVEQGFKEKVGTEQLQKFRSEIANVQAQIAGIEQTLHEKVALPQLQQVKNSLQSIEGKLVGFEQTMQERGGSSEIQALNELIFGVQAKVGGIERSVWEGMDCVQQLEGVISSVKAQCSSLDQASREKVTAQDLQQVSDRLAAVIQKVTAVERAILSNSDRAHQVEEVLNGLGAQVSTLRQALNEKVTVRTGPLQLEFQPAPAADAEVSSNDRLRIP